VHGSFLDERAADAVVCYIACKLLGGDGARPAFGGLGAATLADAHALVDVALGRTGDDVKVSAEFAHVHRDHHRGR
jgi:diaminohydroxyphosphoribosylaminopyrimidine deaminase/5-amino-6-(5-phosphoribosylamino)uracil reductase